MCQIVSEYRNRRVAAPEERMVGLGRRDFLKLAGTAAVTLAAGPAWAQTAKVEVHWLGQAATKLTTLTGKTLVIDPFLVNNPKTPPQWKNLDALGKVDVILVTHGHGDHVGDVAELAKRTDATVMGPAGLMATIVDLGWVPGEKVVRFGKGGKVNPLGPQITITQVRAEHSSEVTVTDPTTKKSTTYPGGEPCGFIVEFENLLTVVPQRDFEKHYEFDGPIHTGPDAPLTRVRTIKPL